MDTELIDLATEPLDETGDVDGRYVSESDYWANFSDEAVHTERSVVMTINIGSRDVLLYGDWTWEFVSVHG